MQSFGLNYEVKPGLVDEFKNTMLQLIEEMNLAEGHIETKVFADVENPNSMMIYSDWKTKAEFSDFIKSDTFKDALEEAVKMLESQPTHFLGENVRLIKRPDE
jgi:quinol monooxygenase YgiN